MAPGAIRFERPAHRFVFDAETLRLPFASADPVALALTREQCERELDALGFAGSLRQRVGALALHGGGGARSLADIAAQLHVSARTLKRRLAELGTSYWQILDAERKRRALALALLRDTTLPLEEIAERLGYSDVANFGRAFPPPDRSHARRGAAARARLSDQGRAAGGAGGPAAVANAASTASISSSRPKGFGRKRTAAGGTKPIAAVQATMGTSAVAASSRSARATSQPCTSGSMRSSSSTHGRGAARTAASAERPSRAMVTAKPEASRTSAIASPLGRSSSATMTVRAMPSAYAARDDHTTRGERLRRVTEGRDGSGARRQPE